jgi:hypothetical protein
LSSVDAPWWVTGGWALDVFLWSTARAHADLDIGVLRRDAHERPLSNVIRRSPDGLPYLPPEIQLLYKAKHPRERDHADFGMWIGEVPIDTSGKVAQIWSIREVEFTPPFPPFSRAITDAIRHWAYEPSLVQSKAIASCMTVTVNINWQ